MDPTVFFQNADAALIALFISLFVWRGVKNGKRKVWRRFMVPAAIWFVHALVFAVASRFHAGPLGMGFDMEDWAWLLSLHAITTLFSYAWTDCH